MQIALFAPPPIESAGPALDPVTGDVLFLGTSGALLILRNSPACGTYTLYGPASPGALGTPGISGAGCARIGQTITIGTTGPAFGIGIVATGFQTNVPYLNLTVLQSTSVTVVSVLDASGLGSLPLLVPLDPALGNNHVYFQAAYLDGSTSSGLIASPGLDILLRCHSEQQTGHGRSDRPWWPLARPRGAWERDRRPGSARRRALSGPSARVAPRALGAPRRCPPRRRWRGTPPATRVPRAPPVLAPARRARPAAAPR